MYNFNFIRMKLFKCYAELKLAIANFNLYLTLSDLTFLF